MSKEKNPNQTSSPSAAPLPAGCRCGQLAGLAAAAGRAGGARAALRERRALHGLGPPRQPRSQPGGRRRPGAAVLRVFFRSFLVCPRGKLPRAMRSGSGTRIPARYGGRTAVPVQQPRGRAEPRSHIPLPCRPPVLVFLSVCRPLPRKRRFSSSSAGRGGVAGRGRSPAGLRPERGLCHGRWVRAARRRGARGARCSKLAAVFELSPFFFLLSLPSFPPSLPPSLPRSLPLSLPLFSSLPSFPPLLSLTLPHSRMAQRATVYLCT